MQKIFAVIVTYNPPEKLLERIESIAQQVSQIIIIDNGSNAENLKIISSIQQKFAPDISIVLNEKNVGLASALNQGIKISIEQKADWVLLLDHDSTPEKNMLTKMFAAHEKYPDKNKIAQIVPEIRDQNVNEITKYLLENGKYLFKRSTINEEYSDKILTAITSGSLIKTEIFAKLGLMSEHFFIDYIDHEFCLRLKKNGYKILLTKDAMLDHRLGDKTRFDILGTSIITTNHSAFRRYYIFRNRLWVCKKYYRDFPNFIIHDSLAGIYDFLRIIFFENNKSDKLFSAIRGLFAGMQKEPK